MVDVVGLRFVTEGEAKALRALDMYRAGLDRTSAQQKQYASQMNAAAQRELQAVRNLMQIRERAARAQEQAAAQAARAIAKEDADQRRSLQEYLRYQREKENAAKAQARAQEQAAAQAARAIARQDAEDRRALQQYLRYQQEKERAAKAQARAQEQAAQEEMRATQRLAAERERLAAQFNPLYAASKQYERALSDLNRAQQMGVVTSQQYDAALEQLALQLQAGGNANQFASRSMNATGVALQQTGYQVGDFLVQVQSGTNWMVAFGQQATQLVGILPMFGSVLGVSGTALIGISAALGIVIPLLTALGAVWMRTRDATDETTEATKQFESALKSLDSTVQDWLTTKKAAAAGLTVQELVGGQSLTEAEAELARAKAVVDRLQQIQAGTQPGMTLRDFSQIAGGVNLPEARAALDKAQQRVDDLRAMMAEVGQQERAEIERQIELLGIRAQYGEDSVEYRQREVELALQAFAEETRARQDIAAGDKEILILREAIRLAQEAAVEASEREGDAQRRLLDAQIAAWVAEEEAYAARMQSANERIAQYEREVALNEAILQYGAESAEVEAVRREQAMAAVEAYIQQEGLTGDIAQRMRDAAAAAYDTDAAVAATANSAKGLSSALKDAATAMSSLAGFSANLDKALAVATAKVDALRAGADAAVAGTIAGMRVDLESRTAAALAAGADRSDVEILYAAGLGQIDQLQTMENERIRLQDANKGGGGGKGTQAERRVMGDVTGKMLRDIEQERELLGLYGQQRREREIAIEIENSLRESKKQATEEQIAAAAAKIAAEERVNETLKRQIEVMDTIGKTLESSLTSGLMSIVDGTKTVGDAFRDMAKLIITELYRVLVVQRLVGSAERGTGIVGAIIGGIGRLFADGAAFSNGDVTPFARGAVMANLNRAPGARVVPFATGGVVGSPMMFPMSGGRTGLMGEAGPEAIMPLKRGSDGKLGVSTNGAAPVVQIINQIPDAQVTREREIQSNGATLERLTVSRAVATGLTTSGGEGKSTMQRVFGVQPRRTVR